ncbi:MAG: type IV toxin-antitoxin system AbiEi family antitoxin [Chitinophagaceae bacterium]
MKEGEIIANALNNMFTLTGVKAKYVRVAGGSETTGHLLIGTNKQKLLVDIRHELRNIPLNLPPEFKKGVGLIVAGYITPQIKTHLKENGINWLDAAGNCFIHVRDLFFFIEGQKVTPLREKKDGKLWTATGLKYVWAILQEPALLNKNFRTQAETAKVALGRVGDFITALKEEGWLAKGKKGWVLEKQQDLENQWTELYPRVLKPKLLIGNFRFVRAMPEKIPHTIVWGGETAAEVYTGFLRPEITTVYTWTDRETAMKNLHLIPDPNGKVLLYEAFWKMPNKHTGLAPIKIVYADLTGTGDSRNIETAERLKK